MSRYTQLASCKASVDANAYIYEIAPLPDGKVAAITSANELLVVDGARLSSGTVQRVATAPTSITTLTIAEQGRSIHCGHVSGQITHFDTRQGGKTGSIDLGQGIIALRSRDHELAVGTEVKQQQAVVSVWDLRQNRIRWQNTANNDDITAVDFHPEQKNLLLIGADDGLVSLFDTSIAEEDDSLVQAVNHGPIHKAGFLHSDALFALSSDQNLVLHPVYAQERDTEPAPVLLGDLRPIIPCEYVIDVIRTGGNYAVATGSHSKSQVDIVNIQDDQSLDIAKPVVIEGAHGDEIVRSLFVHDQSNVIFTAGEDGCIKAFGAAGADKLSTSSKSSKSQRTTEGRYKPY